MFYKIKIKYQRSVYKFIFNTVSLPTIWWHYAPLTFTGDADSL